jgi:large subunit ribosomal protein L25
MSITINGFARTEVGTASAKKLRKQGLIPAIIYNKEGNINLSINAREFLFEYSKGDATATVFDIKLENNNKYRVIPHKIELDPVSDLPVHADFILCKENAPIAAWAKVKFTNIEKSPGIKRGGFLHTVVRKVRLLCEGEKHIPTHVEIDIGTLHLGSKIRSAQLILPHGVSLVKKSNFLIASIIGRGKSEDDSKQSGGEATASKAEEKKSETKK